MSRLKAKIGLAVVRFGIRILESQPFSFLTDEDKSSLSKLWEYHDQFAGELTK